MGEEMGLQKMCMEIAAEMFGKKYVNKSSSMGGRVEPKMA